MASHIGKLPIAVPAGVEITVNGSIFQAKGPKGTDSFELPEGISVSVEDGHVTFTLKMMLAQPVQSMVWLALWQQALSRVCLRASKSVFLLLVPVTVL